MDLRRTVGILINPHHMRMRLNNVNGALSGSIINSSISTDGTTIITRIVGGIPLKATAISSPSHKHHHLRNIRSLGRCNSIGINMERCHRPHHTSLTNSH